MAADIFKGELVTCQNSLPNYIVTNPFELGMVAYLSKINYNIIDNITETYGCTGLYAGPFVKTYFLLAEKIRNYGLLYLEDSFKSLTLYNLIYSTLCAFYAVITLLVIYLLKGMNKKINELLKFLNYNLKPVNKKKRRE